MFVLVQEAKFLISQQKYLELLEAGKTGAALTILRQELAPLNVDPDQLHSLSRWVNFFFSMMLEILTRVDQPSHVCRLG